MLTSADVGAVVRRFPDAWQAELSDEPVALGVEALGQTVIGLKIEVPVEAEPGSTHRLDLVQRSAETGRPTGGVAVEVHVTREEREGE